MSTGARLELMQRVLWPAQPARAGAVWAVLDLARDPRIHQMLLASRLEYLCLYAGRLPRELELVAPHIVELLPGHRLLEQLSDEAWGRSWGVMVRLADPTILRHHLRKFLRVRDEGGRSLLFRYYDPRVLRAYLPTCTPAELELFFGPLSNWIAEGEGGNGLIEYGRGSGGALSQRVAALQA